MKPKRQLVALMLGVVAFGVAIGRADQTGIAPEDEVVLAFVVHVPTDTADDAELHLSGNHAGLGNWSGSGLVLERTDDGTYRGQMAVPLGTALQFKVTRGTWESVEKNADATERANRTYTADADATIDLTVERWRHPDDDPPPPPPSVVGDLRLHEVAAAQGVPGRTVRVWLPPGYDAAENATRRYPVLYLHDGQKLFDVVVAGHTGEWKADENATELIEAGTIEPVILVGLDNAGSARLKEYMSRAVQVRENMTIGGEGADYMRFVVEAVMPLIDETYRTKTDAADTGSGGSSLGAVISLELLANYPQRFGKAAVMSPSLWVDSVELVDRLVPRVSADARVWVDMGDREADGGETAAVYVALARRLAEQLEDHGVAVRFDVAAGAKHNEAAWAQRFGDVLTFLYPAP